MTFLSYFLTLTPSVNGFAEIPATLVSELGCHVGIHFKQVGSAVGDKYPTRLYSKG